MSRTKHWFHSDCRLTFASYGCEIGTPWPMVMKQLPISSLPNISKGCTDGIIVPANKSCCGTTSHWLAAPRVNHPLRQDSPPALLQELARLQGIGSVEWVKYRMAEESEATTRKFIGNAFLNSIPFLDVNRTCVFFKNVCSLPWFSKILAWRVFKHPLVGFLNDPRLDFLNPALNFLKDPVLS